MTKKHQESSENPIDREEREHAAEGSQNLSKWDKLAIGSATSALLVAGGAGIYSEIAGTRNPKTFKHSGLDIVVRADETPKPVVEVHAEEKKESEIAAILKRLEELKTNASSPTLGDTERGYLDFTKEEIEAIFLEDLERHEEKIRKQRRETGSEGIKL